MHKLRIFFIGLSFLLVGCSPLATFDYAPPEAFTDFQSYAIQAPEKAASLDDGRVESAVNQALAGRYASQDAAQADFLVRYRFDEERSFNDSGFSFGLGTAVGSRGRVGVSTRPSVREEIGDVLLLDIIDRESGKVVWSARANRTLSKTASPERRDALISELVNEMLANFPPARG